MAATRHLKKYVDYTSNGVNVALGNIFPGEFVIAGGILPLVAFDGTPTIDVGLVKDGAGGSAAPQAYASAVVVTSLGQKLFDELANTGNKRITVADQIVAKLSATSPTVGKAIVWAELLTHNPLNDL